MTGTCCGEYKGSHGPGPFFGRLALSLIFILAGIGKIFDFQGVVEAIRAVGIHGAYAFAFVGLLMELVGGFSLALGWYTRIGSVILMIFLLPVTLIFHAFWNYTGMEMALQLAMFLKNISIYGGLILLMSYGPGRWSIDAWRFKKSK